MKKLDTLQQEKTLTAIYSDLITAIGENVNREGLAKTPKRAAVALQFLTQGYQQNVDELVKGALFASTNSEMVLLQNIEFFSLCEHHLLPIIGKCHVAYIPNGKVIGLSKIPRIVDMFARRLQVQENLTVQIAESIQKITNSLGVGVIVEAEHLCMIARGVEKKHVTVKTSSLLGIFKKDSATRNEFLSLLKK
jgi:GTP cyclohydrolase IA